MRHNLLKSLIIAAMALFLLAACSKSPEKIKGDGNKQTVSRTLNDFQSLALAGRYDVVIVGGMPQQVTLTADSNVLNYIQTKVEGGVLKIDVSPDVMLVTKEPPLIQISVPSLKQISVAGMAKVNVVKMRADNLNVTLSGAANLNLSGTANKFTVAISGMSDVNAQDLVSRSADINVSGSGHVSVNASEELNVKVAGTGLIEYYGTPAKINQSISGTGRVIGISSNATKN
jgi:hypothetical protein